MIGSASTASPTAAGMDISMVALTPSLIFWLMDSKSFWAKSDDTVGIMAEDIAAPIATGILAITTTLPEYTPYNLDAPDSVKSFMFIRILMMNRNNFKYFNNDS